MLSQIRQLLPEDDPARDIKIQNERLSLKILVKNSQGQEVEIPDHLEIKHHQSLVKLLHRPRALYLFRFNLSLDIDAVEKLHETPPATEIRKACERILNALYSTYPYLLVYRFGPKEGESMRQGIEELQRLAQWAEENNFNLSVTPIRKYFSTGEGKEITQTIQEISGSLM